MSEASFLAWKLGSYKGGYAKKPNSKPAWNKTDYYCIGCRKRDKPYNINSGKGHERCFRRYYGIKSVNLSHFKPGELRCIEQARKNNTIAKCPHCLKMAFR